MPADLPAWERIDAALESKRYYLELAALNALKGDAARAEALLERFQTAQRRTAEPLRFPAWLGEELTCGWDAAVAERERLERATLMDPGVSPERLAAAGLLPL